MIQGRGSEMGESQSLIQGRGGQRWGKPVLDTGKEGSEMGVLSLPMKHFPLNISNLKVLPN